MVGMGTIHVARKPYQWEAEAAAGIRLSDGAMWHGTRIKYRPGTTGRWRYVTVLDLHPMDTPLVTMALRAHIAGGVSP